MRAIKSVCGTSFEDFNPANLSIIETQRSTIIDAVARNGCSPKGKLVPVGMFHRPRSVVEKPTEKVNSIKNLKCTDQSKTLTCDQCTTLNTKLIQSEGKVINLCIENAKLKSTNQLKSNPCKSVLTKMRLSKNMQSMQLTEADRFKEGHKMLMSMKPLPLVRLVTTFKRLKSYVIVSIWMSITRKFLKRVLETSIATSTT
jgi:hypothetical protein